MTEQEASEFVSINYNKKMVLTAHPSIEVEVLGYGRLPGKNVFGWLVITTAGDTSHFSPFSYLHAQMKVSVLEVKIGPGFLGLPISTLCRGFHDSNTLSPLGTGSNIPAKPLKSNDYPHKCPRCSSPAYLGFNSVDCSKCK